MQPHRAAITTRRDEHIAVATDALDELLRTSGQDGPRVPVPDDARAQDRLVGFIGRDFGGSPAAFAALVHIPVRDGPKAVMPGLTPAPQRATSG